MGSKLLCVYTVMPLVAIVIALLTKHIASCFPLSTSSRWIVDDSSGSRVTLSCVNWASHLTPMLAEGLHLRPLESIAHTVVTWGFNCVILSWATRMFTNKTLAEARVSQTFRDLGLEEELEGLASFNGELVSLTSVEAFKEVVSALGKEGLMVVLDNRVGGYEDANFGDETWVQGLQIVASLFEGWPFVVGMILRNELKGSIEDRFRHMQKGAEAINSRDSDLLIIHEGLRNAEDFHNLTEAPLSEALRRKTVYEVRINMEGGVDVAECEARMQHLWESLGLLSDSTFAYRVPFMVSDYGRRDVNDLNGCLEPWFTADATWGDMNLAVWVLQGSYYFRQGVRDDDETLGLFNHQWKAPRNALLRRNLQVNQDRGGRPHTLLFHPRTGLCVNKVNVNGLEMGSCKEGSSWKLSPQGHIDLDSTYLVIGAQGPNQPAVLELQGTQANGPWILYFSTHHMQVSTTLMGQTLCLDSPTPPSILTNPCACLDTPPNSSINRLACKDNPVSQWFLFVSRLH